MVNTRMTESKQQTPQEPQPDEQAGFTVSDHILIQHSDSGNVIINQRA